MILITGATGMNGVEIVKLLSRRDMPYCALVRNRERAGVLLGLPGVEIAYGDFAQQEALEPHRFMRTTRLSATSFTIDHLDCSSSSTMRRFELWRIFSIKEWKFWLTD